VNFGFTEEQQFLRESVRKFLDEQCPMGEVRRLMAEPAGYSADLWKQIAELGWLGLALPEAYGGAGLGWVDRVVLFEETGRSLFPSPFLSTTLAGAIIDDAGSEAQKERWLSRIADGTTIGSVALVDEIDAFDPQAIALRGEADGDGFTLTGEKRFVTDANAADLFVVAFRTSTKAGNAAEDLALAVVERSAAGVATENVPGLDATKRTGTLRLDGVRVAAADLLGASGDPAAAVERLFDYGAIAVTAEAIGSAEAAHATTVQYAKDRVQFGHPIGHFQGVKHPLADMYVDIESIKSLLYYAAWAANESPADLARYASLAKSYAAEAFTRIGVECVQLHGAVGFTFEYDAQLYLKRSKWSRALFGDADHHCDRVAALRGI